MRIRFFAIVLVLCAIGWLCLAPKAHGRWGCSGGYSGPVYYGPGAMAYGPQTYYQPYPYVAPMPGQPYYGAPRAPARPTTAVSVAIADDNFQPPTLNVQPGTTVRWLNQGRHTHTITSKDGRWDSGDIPAGGSYSATFQHPGTYYYYCRHHKGMEGTIVVGSGGNGGAATPRY
jgi:plastocyanin